MTAIRDYDKAIQLKPDYDRAYYNRGQAYVQDGDFDKGIADFKKVLELSNDQALRPLAEQQLRSLGVK